MRLAVPLLLLLTLATACTGNEILEACETGGDCASGLCLPARPPVGGALDFFCSQTCETTCPNDAVCAVTNNTVSHCVPRCTEDVPSVLVCDDGVPVYCDEGGTLLDCTVCGCADGSKPVCDPDSHQCAERRAVGEPCGTFLDCATGNCGELPGSNQKICFDFVGGPCTDETCGACDPADGFPTCSQACVTHDECWFDSARCYRKGADDQKYCRQDCTSTDCPTGFTCQLVDDPDLLGEARRFCFAD